MNIDGTNIRPLTGLPADAKLGGVSWSDDSRWFAFTNTTDNGVELWVADAAAMTAKKSMKG